MRRVLVTNNPRRSRPRLGLYGHHCPTQICTRFRQLHVAQQSLARNQHGLRANSKPTASLYATLIVRNGNADNGSAANVASLLKDMEREGIEIGNDVCHAALRALAVHPDPFLRKDVLENMQGSWFELSRVGWHDVIAGLLKNGQAEEALDAMDEMRQKQISINGWLLDMTVYTLCAMGEFDEALRIMQDRIRSGEAHVSASAWYQLFDAACTVLHYDSLAFVWARQVESQYLKPSNGHCLAVLQASARAGDVTLAIKVFHELSNWGASLISQHYELLMDAYFATDDLKTPLTILCIMNSAGIVPSRRTTRRLYEFLCLGRERTQQAFDILVDLRHENHKRVIPTAAMDTILEVTLAHNTAGSFRGEQPSSNEEDLATAVYRYKQLHKLCPTGPTLDTFNTLLSGCAATSGHKATAMFLASEMLYLKVQPNAATYDYLLIVCLTNDSSSMNGNDSDSRGSSKKVDKEYEDAFRYYQEMRDRKWMPRPSTFERMVKRCAAVGDQRAWVLVERMREAEMDIVGIRRWLSANWRSAQA